MSDPSDPPVHIPESLQQNARAEEAVDSARVKIAHIPASPFTSSSQPQSIPSAPIHNRNRIADRAGWGGTLVIACLALGLAGSVVEMERGRVATERNRIVTLEAADSLTQGRQEDLGKFLADPNTRFVRLTRTAGSAIDGAAIAWNEARQIGFVFSDHLPPLDDDQQYQVWATDRGNHRLQIASFRVKPGSSVFQLQTSSPISSILRIEIIPGGKATENGNPILSGSVD